MDPEELRIESSSNFAPFRVLSRLENFSPTLGVMPDQPPEDFIWNRASTGISDMTSPGDRALANLLRIHGHIMNGGVFHAVDCLTPEELAGAKEAFRFYGLESAAITLDRATAVLEAEEDPEIHESELDEEYDDAIPNDEFLVTVFKNHLKSNPSEYAPA